MANLQSAIRFLLPKEDHFYDYLEAQGRACQEAAVALAQFSKGRGAGEVRDAVQVIEHDADAYVRKMEDALARTFVTPLDREDLHRLCSELDNVVDHANFSARAASMYGVSQPSSAMSKLMEVLVACAEVLQQSVPMLRVHQYPELLGLGRKIRGLEKDADAIYRAEISALFANPAVDAKELLRQKEVLDGLEDAIDACDHVADLLSNLAVKHG
jgi:uncharacterized protein Yka (UPF0111/DUF47 family)